MPVSPRKWAPAKTCTRPYYASVIWYGGKFLQSNAAAKMCTNREFGHPTHCILHAQYILHTGVKTCCWVLTADLTDSEVLHTSRSESASAQTSVLRTRLFHLVLSSTFPLSKEIHTISPSIANIAVHVNCTQVTLVPLTKLLQVPVSAFVYCRILWRTRRLRARGQFFLSNFTALKPNTIRKIQTLPLNFQLSGRVSRQASS